jgi:hypothetical protein
MATVRSVLTSALTEIGAFSPQTAPNTQDFDAALGYFQRQLDAWQADRLTLYKFTRTIYTLPSGTSTRTVGPTGQIVATGNPLFINGINYIVPGSSPSVETPMGRMDFDSYQTLSIKDLDSSLPTLWFFVPAATNGTLTFWPVVTQDVDIAIYIHFGVSVPTTINDTVEGPPGHLEAFHYQLALRLCTPFGRPTPELLPKFAAESYARIKRLNVSPGLLGVDAALVPHGSGSYNILSDTTTTAS